MRWACSSVCLCKGGLLSIFVALEQKLAGFGTSGFEASKLTIPFCFAIMGDITYLHSFAGFCRLRSCWHQESCPLGWHEALGANADGCRLGGRRGQLPTSNQGMFPRMTILIASHFTAMAELRCLSNIVDLFLFGTFRIFEGV